jgi:hypothetical protein
MTFAVRRLVKIVLVILLAFLVGLVASVVGQTPATGSGTVSLSVSGELKAWHKVTLDLAGPAAAETDTAPNPFTDYRFTVTFTHESGAPSYRVPGYFAADGRAGETGATRGNVWRAHLSPDQPGRWTYAVEFLRGSGVAVGEAGAALAPYDGAKGAFTVAPSDKTGRDFRAQGRLVRRGRYLYAAGTGARFIKAGVDSPETLLGTADFDGTEARIASIPLKKWTAHVPDWRDGDPAWRGGKGKGLVGAFNYLAAAGANAVSFLTYNVAGDGDNVWPFIAPDAKRHYDCSKLDQWEIVFAHAQQLGIFLHFKFQEQENDDHVMGGNLFVPEVVPAALDAGDTGPERKLYLRELIARFGHHLALNWNLGEENTQSPRQQRDMIAWIKEVDPYDHPVVVHSFIPSQDRVYTPLLGSDLDGASLQTIWLDVHRRTLKWLRDSAATGRPWMVCNDEFGPAWGGVPPDDGYAGYQGVTRDGRPVNYTQHDIRKNVIWGNLMAGGAGVEMYFGYQLPDSDITCENFRSRDRFWPWGRIAADFFASPDLPLESMTSLNWLVYNPHDNNSVYCLAQPDRVYLVYVPDGAQQQLDLREAKGDFTLAWFNPRTGGQPAPAGTVKAGGMIQLHPPSADDWLAVVRKK